MLGMKAGKEARAMVIAHQSGENLQIIHSHHSRSEETRLSRCRATPKNTELTEDSTGRAPGLWARAHLDVHAAPTSVLPS